MAIKQLVVVLDQEQPLDVHFLQGVVARAAAAGNVVLLDADIKEGRLAELLGASLVEQARFVGSEVALISPTRCDGCGACVLACRLRAIHSTASGFEVDPAVCEACHSCYYQCPVHAIDMVQLESGTWHKSTFATGLLFSGRLDSGQEDSGKLLNLVRVEARAAALAAPPSVLIIAAPARNPEAVSSCLVGADLVLFLIATSQELSLLDDLRVIASKARVAAMAFDVGSREGEPLHPQVESRFHFLELSPGETVSSLPWSSVPSLDQAWRLILRRVQLG